MPQITTFNTATNQAIQYAYDAAGNLMSDGFHAYTYDAEGNVLAVDSGSTAAYVYDALNHRVQTSVQGIVTQFAFGLDGRRVSSWDGGNCAPTLLTATTYWNGAPVSLYDGSQSYYQHQDLLGTERLRTTADGTVMGAYQSLPFGDGLSVAGADYDPYHFAMLDHDSESATEHAQFRQYSSTQGRWMSPDPYDGSYSPNRPQSYNRYNYARNNPLMFVDPTGMNDVIDCTTEYDGTDDTGYTYCQSIGSYGDDGGGGGGGQVSSGGGGGGPGPNSEVPPNPCLYQGSAMSPDQYAGAGALARNIPTQLISNFQSGFAIGGPLDAQPHATGNVYQRAAYGNYVFGVYMQAAGFPLFFTLDGANFIAKRHKARNPRQYANRTMDPNYPFLPTANVTNITAGWMAQKNGTTCHK